MKTGFRAVALLLAVAACGCARDGFDSLRKEQVQTVGAAVDLLATIKDRDSAEKAKPKLKQLGDKWRDLEKRMDALPTVPAEEDARVRKQYDDQLNSLMTRYLGEAIRVAFVPGGKEALDEVGEIKKKK